MKLRKPIFGGAGRRENGKFVDVVCELVVVVVV